MARMTSTVTSPTSIVASTAVALAGTLGLPAMTAMSAGPPGRAYASATPVEQLDGPQSDTVSEPAAVMPMATPTIASARPTRRMRFGTVSRDAGPMPEKVRRASGG